MDRKRASADPTIAVIAIASDNSWVHVYRDVKSLIAETDIGDGEGASSAVEFFDSRGHRLAPVFNRNWQLRGLQETGDRPNRRHVQQRLTAVIQHVRARVEGNPGSVEALALTLDQAIAALPALEGLDLDECVELLVVNFGATNSSDEGGIGILDTGSPLHMLLCHTF